MIEIIVLSSVFVLLIFLGFWGPSKEELEEQKEIEEERKQLEEQLKKDKLIVNEMAAIDFSRMTFKEMEQGEKDFSRKWDSISGEGKNEFRGEITKIYHKMWGFIEPAEKKYKKEMKEKKKKEEEKRKYHEQVEELFQFKKKRNSAEALPLDKKYSYDIKKSAYYQMMDYLEEKLNRKEAREKAIEYYSLHDTDSKPDLENEVEEEVYNKVREEIKSGKMDISKKENIEYKGKKLPKVFYRVKELDNVQRAQAKTQGFIRAKTNELDGKVSGGGFLINKKNPRETAKHFVWKHLFAKLHDNAQIEYQIGDKRVDVAICFHDCKIGIEVETGANKPKQFTAKKYWLDQNFDLWMFVCPREHLNKYAHLVDNRKSYCLTPKKAKEMVLEWVNTVDPPLE